MAKKIGIGLSISSVGLLKTLKTRKYVDEISLPLKALSALEDPPEDLNFQQIQELLKKNWKNSSVFILVGALGAFTRLIAPLLTNKEDDPAVLVLDSRALNVVPLVGGHLAGADDLAIQLAEELGGKAIITGESNNQGRLALDAFGYSWGWNRSGKIKDWNELMHRQSYNSKLKIFQQSGTRLWNKSIAAKNLLQSDDLQRNLSSYDFIIGPQRCNKCGWHPATLWIGIGCERNTSFSLLERSISEALERSELAEEAVAGLATIDIKDNEQGLIKLSHKKGWPIRFFNSQKLSKISVPNPSEIVAQEVGCNSVAEASSVLASGSDSELLQEKIIFFANEYETGAATIAISESKTPFSPRRGQLHIVGIGPGDISYLTGDARRALAKTPIWIGYSRYLDYIDSLRRKDQIRINGELTLEKERCIQSIDLATQGLHVSLVSSGDSGIYGMAGLALEYLLKKPKDERPALFIHPGISAVQSAASKIGSPLTNDFCVVSLSDKLTPWSKIKQRINGAAKGDFVIAFYNPKSKQRTWQLIEAIKIISKFRGPETPLVLARQVGREEEQIEIYSLGSFPVDSVDMLTTVIIGNTKSKVFDNWFLTTRGYLD